MPWTGPHTAECQALEMPGTGTTHCSMPLPCGHCPVALLHFAPLPFPFLFSKWHTLAPMTAPLPSITWPHPGSLAWVTGPVSPDHTQAHWPESLGQSPLASPSLSRHWHWGSSFLKKHILNLLISFLAVLGLRCCARAFSSCGWWGLLFWGCADLLWRLLSLGAQALGVRASVIAAHGLSTWGTWA